MEKVPFPQNYRDKSVPKLNQEIYNRNQIWNSVEELEDALRMYMD